MTYNTGISAGAAETAPLAIDGPQPVWMTLNEARERAFTGEIVFETEPEVFAYLDHGVVYYAERASDAALGRRLLEAGLVDATQLERGTVRIGDTEHLGRLFDRVPSVDRDAVVVMAETMTEELIADVANRSIATARVTAYRHHPSGVHRWFVAPVEPTAVSRPVSEISQLDTTVVDDLPVLPFLDTDDEFVIEWDDEIDGIPELRVDAFEPPADLVQDTDDADIEHTADVELTADVETIDVFDVETIEELDLYPVEELDLYQVEEPELERLDETAPEIIDEAVVETVEERDPEPADGSNIDVEVVDGRGLEGIETVAGGSATEADQEQVEDFEFSVVWPDGSEEPAALADSVNEETDQLDDGVQLVFTRYEDGHLEFNMPPLDLSDEPELADVPVPEDVAEAVRRAISAIESAGIAEHYHAVESQPAPPDQPAGGSTGFTFAPPTMATRAEVLYGLVADAGSDTADSAWRDAWPGAVTDAQHAGSTASLEQSSPDIQPFGDEPSDGGSGGDERSSALRRLISSLRRKDH